MSTRKPASYSINQNQSNLNSNELIKAEYNVQIDANPHYSDDFISNRDEISSNSEEESANNHHNEDVNNTEVNNKLNEAENDAHVDDTPAKDPFLSCIRGKKSSDSEIEENTPKNKRGKRKLDKTKERYNTRALTILAPTYMLELFDKNLLIIFNQYEIPGYRPRLGTYEDVGSLVSTFKQYGFTDKVFDKLTKQQIFDKLDEYAKEDFTDYGCVAVVVMTHGADGGRIMARDREYSELDILNRLKVRKNPTLVTKPVILFIQACRGFENTEGVAVNKPEVPKDQQGETQHYYLPLEADTLVFHSSYNGKPSYRPADGSWFIQTLCKKINEMSDTHDLESILIEVKREVACNFESLVKSRVNEEPTYSEREAQPGSSIIIEHHKQMPTVTSALIRKLYLKRKPADIVASAQILPDNIQSRTRFSSDTVDNAVVKGNPITNLYYTKEQSDPCLCYLDHFVYMKNCLSHYIAKMRSQGQEDRHAQYLLDSLPPQKECNTELVKSKLEDISNFLLNKPILSDSHKFMYFYGAISDGPSNSESSTEKMALAPKWEEFKNYMPGVALGLSVYIATQFVHNIINK